MSSTRQIFKNIIWFSLLAMTLALSSVFVCCHRRPANIRWWIYHHWLDRVLRCWLFWCLADKSERRRNPEPAAGRILFLLTTESCCQRNDNLWRLGFHWPGRKHHLLRMKLRRWQHHEHNAWNTKSFIFRSRKLWGNINRNRRWRSDKFNYQNNNNLSTNSNIWHRRTLKSVPLNIRHAYRGYHTIARHHCAQNLYLSMRRHRRAYRIRKNMERHMGRQRSSLERLSTRLAQHNLWRTLHAIR